MSEYKFPLEEEDFSVLHDTGTGQVFSVLSMACGYDDYYDVLGEQEHYTAEAQYTAIRGYANDALNFINDLNENERGTWHIWDVYRRMDTDLLFGAWLYLEQRDLFDKHYDEWRAHLFDAEHPYEDSEMLPEDLRTEVETIRENAEENLWNEFLYGDRSGGGLLFDLEHKLSDYVTDIDYDKDSHTFGATVDLEVYEEQEDYVGNREHLNEAAKEAVISEIEYMYKSEKRRRFERTQKYQEQAQRRREVERRREQQFTDRVASMKKEG